MTVCKLEDNKWHSGTDGQAVRVLWVQLLMGWDRRVKSVAMELDSLGCSLSMLPTAMLFCKVLN